MTPPPDPDTDLPGDLLPATADTSEGSAKSHDDNNHDEGFQHDDAKTAPPEDPSCTPANAPKAHAASTTTPATDRKAGSR